jgi:hypothetical protein
MGDSENYRRSVPYEALIGYENDGVDYALVLTVMWRTAKIRC